MLKVGRTHVNIFWYRGDPEGPHDRMEMVGLIMIERIEPIESPIPA